VEIAGAIAELTRRTLSREFRNVDPAGSRIVLVEAGPRILPAFPVRLAGIARASLEKMGVEVRTDLSVTACDRLGVVAQGERIEAAIVVWAAGVMASPAAIWLDAAHDRAGRVFVEADLTLAGNPEISVIGDTAAVISPSGRTVPGVAPAAKQMGRYVGQRLALQMAVGRSSDSFVYRHQGDLATIGRNSAILSLGRVELTGFPAWLFWSLVHILFLISFRSRVMVVVNWLTTYLTRQRAVRLLSDAEKGPPGATQVGRPAI
jgi:NADH dehydrogenase